ncbi:trpS [Symbiodinium necroappetens]|uniref:Threonylcarbamoyl-AMP synthase n=1 Tax=Symbiodinium necroappetens TaxID=1628268 RepID=A0A812IPM3_9DINO|nr:trpS [Symbiodinium necroappetens]
MRWRAISATNGELGVYARVDNSSYRLLKRATPGPFTFILRASKEVPKRLVHEKRRTIGIRVPDHPVAQMLLELMGEPIMTTTLRLPDDDGEEQALFMDGEDIAERLGKQLDVIIDAGACGLEESTVIDLTEDVPQLVRHLHGVLKNWVQLQHEYECFFFVADFHALTTDYEESQNIEQYTFDTVVDWLAAGVNPGTATIFVQSRVPEHAELHLLLSMITPISWLERVPSFKDQQQKLSDRDLATYGFLGYPLLQAADILVYRAGWVPVGADQVAHVELTREVARRFNHIYGREPGFEDAAEAAVKKMSKKAARMYGNLRKEYLEKGDGEALERARALLAEQQNLSIGDRERLFGYLEGGGRIILPEPQSLLTKTAKMPGLDGEKMSKSYNNYISLREEPDSVEAKIRTMQTDPARVRRSDPGEPENCPVFALHEVYSTEEVRKWATQGCRSAGIGCVDCKKPLIDAINEEQLIYRQRAQQFEEEPDLVHAILAEGSEKARNLARETLDDVKEAIGISHR